MSDKAVKDKINELHDIMDQLELVKQDMENLEVEPPRADSFLSGATGKVEMAIDELSEAIFDHLNYLGGE